MKNSQMYILNQFVVNKKELLGRGATGQVYAAKNITDQSQVAVKIIDLKSIDNEVTQYLLNMEKIAVMSVNNPHVLKGIKVVENSRYCHIVTELCNGGTLKDTIKYSGPLGQEKSLKIMIELLKGMCSLIAKGIIHRDLKPANVLFHNGQTKIIDFGYCEIRGHPKPKLEYNVGSPSYMAPQAFLDNQYSQKTEIWALGVTFYELLNGKTFDNGKNMTEVFREIKKNGLPYRRQVSDKCRKLIDWCLQFDPKKRPTTVQLLNHVVTPVAKPEERQPSQSVRVSFAPVENVDFKVKLQQKMQEIRSNIDNFWKDGPRKEDILKSTNRPKAGLSTYSQKKKVFEQKFVNQKVPYEPTKTKYQKMTSNFIKPTMYRNKSEYLDENLPGYVSDRLKSKQKLFASNPYKSRFTAKKVESSKIRNSVNVDYYGMATKR